MSRSILWVDDNPKNNEIPVQVLKALQATVVQALSTRQALAQLKARKFDAIVSDMGRREGMLEGYALLHEVRRMGLTIPYFIFAAGGSAPENVAMAHDRGANGSTSRPTELLEQLHAALYGAESGNSAA
jgi:CheY-like chemotaxis protein